MSGDGFTLHPKAHALSAFRVLKNGSSRTYSATTFPNDPWQGCWMYVNRAQKLFGLWSLGSDEEPDRTASRDYYAVLDVWDDNGDLVQDFAIPDARCFRYLKKQLGWVVERDDSREDR